MREAALLTLQGATSGGHDNGVYLSCLPQDLHILVFLGAHVLAQQFEQLGDTGCTA